MKKIIAVLMTLAIVFGTLGAVGFAAENDNEEYYGEVLAAINTSFTEDGTFSVYCKENAEATEEDEEPEDSVNNEESGRQIPEAVPLSPEEAALMESQSRAKSEAAQKPINYNVGDVKNVLDYYDEYTKILNMKCIYVGEYCTVWTQIDIEKTDEEYFTDEQCIAYGEWFDEMIPEELELFGDMRVDTDKDGKIAVFFHDIDDEEGFTCGFFRNYDLISEDGKTEDVWMRELVDSNHCDCIHMNRLKRNKDVKSTLVHEYQHYLHYGYTVIGKTNGTYFKDAAAVTEGFSTAAQFILDEIDREYDHPTHGTNLFEFEGEDCYELEFAFFQYVRTRYAQLTGETGDFAGKGVYKEILERMSREKQAENEDVPQGFRIAADLLYPEESYPEFETSDERLKQLIVDFWIALFKMEDTGIYGFNGDSVAELLDHGKVYNYLESGNRHKIAPGNAEYYVINFGQEGTAVITEKSSDDMVFVPISGVCKKLYIDLNDGSEPQYCTYVVGSGWVNLYNYTEDILIYKASLKGWDINGEQYASEDDVFIDSDVTAYPITEAPEEIGLEKQVFDGTEYEVKCYSFTPEITGSYCIDCLLVTLLDSNDEYVDLISYYNDNEDESLEYYELEAGETYYLYCYKYRSFNEETGESDYGDCEITVSYQENNYTLTYDYNGMSDIEPQICNGADKYNVYRANWTAEDILETGLVAAGWAKDKNAEEPEYAPDDTIVITEDTTLYAVWTEAPKFNIGENDVEEFTSYVFEAPQAGIYSFTGEDESIFFLTVSGSDSEMYFEDTAVVELEAGEKCVIENFFGSKITVEDTTDSVAGKVTYRTGEGFFFSSKGLAVTSFEPASAIIGVSFAGWSTDPDATEPEYKAGDSFFRNGDETLYAVWTSNGTAEKLGKEVTSFITLPLLFKAAAADIKFIFQNLGDIFGGKIKLGFDTSDFPNFNRYI